MIEIADPDSDQLRLRAVARLGRRPAGGHELARRRGQAVRPRLRDRGLLPVAGRRGHGAGRAPTARRYESQRNGAGSAGVGPPLADGAAHPRRRAHRRLGVARRPVRPPPARRPTSCGSCGPSPTRRWPRSATPPTSTSSRSWRRLDGLTGALNRRAFFERLDLELPAGPPQQHAPVTARDVRPRPVQGAQRRPRPPGRRRRPAQLHPDPRAQRPGHRTRWGASAATSSR